MTQEEELDALYDKIECEKREQGKKLGPGFATRLRIDALCDLELVEWFIRNDGDLLGETLSLFAELKVFAEKTIGPTRNIVIVYAIRVIAVEDLSPGIPFPALASSPDIEEQRLLTCDALTADDNRHHGLLLVNKAIALAKAVKEDKVLYRRVMSYWWGLVLQTRDTGDYSYILGNCVAGIDPSMTGHRV